MGKAHPSAWINGSLTKPTLDPQLLWLLWVLEVLEVLGMLCVLCVLRSGIFRPGGILQTVAGCQPYRWLQFGLWTKMALSLRHSAKTSPPM